MTEMDLLHADQVYDNTDIFIVGNGDDIPHFVTIDESFADLSDAVMIDMSNDETFDAISIDINHDPDLFVTLDHDVILSGFTDEEFNSTITDLDIAGELDIHNV